MKAKHSDSDKSVSIFKDSSQDNMVITSFDNPYWFGVMDEFGGYQAHLETDQSSGTNSKPKIKISQNDDHEHGEYGLTFGNLNNKNPSPGKGRSRQGGRSADEDDSEIRMRHLASQATDTQHINSKYSDPRYRPDKSNDADSIVMANRNSNDRRYKNWRMNRLRSKGTETPSRKHSFFNSSSMADDRSGTDTDRMNPLQILLAERKSKDASRKRMMRELEAGNRIGRMFSHSQDVISQKYQQLQAKVDQVAEIDAREEDLGYTDRSLPSMKNNKRKLKRILRGGSLVFAEADDDVFGEKALMNSQPIILKDREEATFRLGDKSYIRGCFDSHHRLLPLRIEVESSYIFFELFLEFNMYPSFTTPFLKSSDNVTVVGQRHQKLLVDDRSLKFCLYSHKACSVKIYVEFSLVKPREVDLGTTKMERLLNFKPYLEFKLREGRVAEKARKLLEAKKAAKEKIRQKLTEEEERIEYEAYIRQVTVVSKTPRPPAMLGQDKLSESSVMVHDEHDLPHEDGKDESSERKPHIEVQGLSDDKSLKLDNLARSLLSIPEAPEVSEVPGVTIVALKSEENENDLPALSLLRLVSEISEETRKKSVRSIVNADGTQVDEPIPEHENIREIRRLVPRSGLNIGEVDVHALSETELIRLIKHALEVKKGPPTVKGLSMFFSKKKGLKEYIHSQNVRLEQQTALAKVKKEALYEEERARMFEDIERRNKKPPSQLEMLTSVTTRMLKTTRQQILVKLLLVLNIFHGIRKHLKKERFEVDLYFFFSMVRKIGILKRYSARTYKPKPLGIVCDVQQAFRLRGMLGMDSLVLQQAKNMVGKVLSKIYFVNTLRGSLLHTNTILKSILVKLRLHKQVIMRYQMQIQSLVEEKLETLLFLENDSDVTLNTLRKLVDAHIKDLVFVLFNMRLSEYLRTKIDKMIKESGSRKEARKQKNIMNLLMGIKTSDYAKEGLDMLARVRSFPVTDRKCRSSEMYPVYEEFSRNQKSIPVFRQWLSDKNPLKKPPDQNPFRKLKTQLTVTRGFSMYQDNFNNSTLMHNPSMVSVATLEKQPTFQVDKTLQTLKDLPPVAEDAGEGPQTLKEEPNPFVTVQELRLPLQTPRPDGQIELASSRTPMQDGTGTTPGTTSEISSTVRKKKVVAREGFKLDLTDNLISCLLFSLWKYYKTKASGSGVVRRARF